MERAPVHGLGRAKRLDDAGGRYIEFVKNTFPRGLRLEGLRVVLDCANGAAYRVAPTVLWELGAEVIPLSVSPDGLNINRECGTTAIEATQRSVREMRADLGIALDGDADRLIMVDERGRVLDGDQLMALIAGNWQRSGQLKPSGVVATVMSNLGFERHLAARGIRLTRSPVGDRYVVEEMRRVGSNLGGEQSGHIILGEYCTTGDGLMSALQVLAAIVETGAPASEVCNVFTPVPQLLRNIKANGGTLERSSVKRAIAAGEKRLGNAGRLLVRKSGTEPLIRIMAEGEDEELVAAVVEEIAAVVVAANAGAESAAG